MVYRGKQHVVYWHYKHAMTDKIEGNGDGNNANALLIGDPYPGGRFKQTDDQSYQPRPASQLDDGLAPEGFWL